MWKYIGMAMLGIPIGGSFLVIILNAPLGVFLMFAACAFGVFWIWTGAALFCGTHPREVMQGWKDLLRLP